jgi:hypothetical protein
MILQGIGKAVVMTAASFFRGVTNFFLVQFSMGSWIFCMSGVLAPCMRGSFSEVCNCR